jgi:hypothetical protein
VFEDDRSDHIPQPERYKSGFEIVAKEGFDGFLCGLTAKPVLVGNLKQSEF